MDVYMNEVVRERVVGVSPPITNVGFLLYKIKIIQHIREMVHLCCPRWQLTIKCTRSLMRCCGVVVEARWGLKGEWLDGRVKTLWGEGGSL